VKGTIIAILLGVMVIWSLNHNVLSIFFKIKRQRLYKSVNIHETNNSVEKISGITTSMTNGKRRRQRENRPPLK